MSSQLKTIINRLSKYDLTFKYFDNDEYKNKKTLVYYECKKHGLQHKPYREIVYREDKNFCPDCNQGKPSLQEATDKITEICREAGYKFVSFVDGYKNKKSSFEYICPVHGLRKSVYKNFVNDGSRCSSCTNGTYRLDVPSWFYIFKYTHKEYGDVFKYGITNRDPILRSREHIKGIRNHISNIERLYCVKYDYGEIPHNIETYIKQNYHRITCNWLVSGGTETLSYIDTISLIEYLVSSAIKL